MTAAGLIVLVVTMGALGGVGSRSRAPTTVVPGVGLEGGGPDSSSAAAPATHDPAPPFAPAAFLSIDLAAEPALVRGSTVVVRGTATRSVGRADVSVKLGAATLGRVVKVIGVGPFSVEIPVYSPSEPVEVDVVVRPDRLGAEPLAITSLRLASNGAVEAWSIVSRQTGGRCRTIVDGPAPLTLGTVTARVVESRSTVASAVVPVGLDGAFDGGRLLGLGRWHAELDRPDPSSRGRDAVWLEIDWRDPIDGTHGTLMADVPGCNVRASSRPH